MISKCTDQILELAAKKEYESRILRLVAALVSETVQGKSCVLAVCPHCGGGGVITSPRGPHPRDPSGYLKKTIECPRCIGLGLSLVYTENKE